MDALEKLGPRVGLHIIKEFEPISLYALIGQKGLEKRVEKKSDNEYHVWFFPKIQIEDIEMKKYLAVFNERVRKMLDIELKVFNRELTPDEARKFINVTFDYITAEEFAYGEQHLLNAGITDETMEEGMNDILDVFKDVLVVGVLGLPKGHLIQTYVEEVGTRVETKTEGEIHLKTSGLNFTPN